MAGNQEFKLGYISSGSSIKHPRGGTGHCILSLEIRRGARVEI